MSMKYKACKYFQQIAVLEFACECKKAGKKHVSPKSFRGRFQFLTQINTDTEKHE